MKNIILINSKIKVLENEWDKYAFGLRCGRIDSIIMERHIYNKIKRLRRKLKLELMKC